MAKLKDPINLGDDYHRRTLDEALADQREVENAPLSERQEARDEFTDALRDPALIGERVSWLIDGNYGHGQMLKAKQIIASPRMNRRAALTQLIAVYEWRCPAEFAAKAWNKLSSSEKNAVNAALDIVIDAAEKEMAEEQRSEDLFHVVVVNNKTGKKTYMTSSPVTHDEGCTILKKLTKHSFRTEKLEPA